MIHKRHLIELGMFVLIAVALCANFFLIHYLLSKVVPVVVATSITIIVAFILVVLMLVISNSKSIREDHRRKMEFQEWLDKNNKNGD